MKYFHYKIDNNEVSEYNGEIPSIPPGFIQYKVGLAGESVYYNLANEELTDVISEGIHEDAARRGLEEFLSAFYVSLV